MQIAEALQHVHGKGLIHAVRPRCSCALTWAVQLTACATLTQDLKSLNCVRAAGRWKLIDMDAATQFGDPLGSKCDVALPTQVSSRGALIDRMLRPLNPQVHACCVPAGDVLQGASCHVCVPVEPMCMSGQPPL